jgi:hypothetical protein
MALIQKGQQRHSISRWTEVVWSRAKNPELRKPMTASILVPDLETYNEATILEWCCTLQSEISLGDTLATLSPMMDCTECGETINSSDEACTACGTANERQTGPIISVVATVAGRVASIDAALGARVRSGDVLAQIEEISPVETATDSNEQSISTETDENEDPQTDHEAPPSNPDAAEVMAEDLPDYAGALEVRWRDRTLRVCGDWTIRWLFLAPTYQLMMDDRILATSGGPSTKPCLEASILEGDGSQLLVSAELFSVVGYRPTCQILVDGEVLADGHVRVSNFLHPMLVLFVVISAIAIWYLGPKGLAFIVYTLTEHSRQVLGW